MDAAKVGRRIKAFRKLKGYTQINLAKTLNISIADLRGVERGTLVIPDVFLDQLAKALVVSKNELIGKKDTIKEVE